MFCKKIIIFCFIISYAFFNCGCIILYIYFLLYNSALKKNILGLGAVVNRGGICKWWWVGYSFISLFVKSKEKAIFRSC